MANKHQSRTSRQLIRDIEEFLSESGMSQTSFGELSVNEGHILSHLKNGRDVRVSTMDRIYDFMRDFRAMGHSAAGEGSAARVSV